jgi:nicotinate phosphoribosyltransferase
VFGFEPLLRVTAPLAEAQLVETALLGLVTFQTSIASKAARIVHAADGRPVMEFGSRRAHGLDAALHAARAAYLAGCTATSNVEAGYRFGVPLAGTMAHSWVKAFPSESSAFRAFMDVFGERAVLLIDTYDTLEAARRIVAEGLRPSAVRLDSGDLGALSREVRQIFDAGGLSQTRILASGDLDEWAITELLAAQAPIDGFGVGTSLSTSIDAPALGGIYKLVESERAGMAIPVMKLSGGKPSYPGRKQVWRHGHDGHAVRDTIGLHDEPVPAGAEPLLQLVMRGGHRLPARPSLAASRAHHAAQVAMLPEALRTLDPPVQYPVATSPALDALATRTIAHLTSRS